MLVLIVIAAIVIVAAVVFLATGRGGGMSVERNDYSPLDLGPVSATDVALLRPPTGLWGYNMQATDEAMERIAESIRERDVRIVALEQLVTDLSRDHAPMPVPASPYPGARHRRGPAVPAETEAVQAPYDANTTEQVPYASAAEMDWQPVTHPAYEDETAWQPVTPPADETARLPFEPPGPGGDMSGQPPEKSHD